MNTETPINAIIRFVDQNGERWTAFAATLPLKKTGEDEFCELSEAFNREFRIESFTYVETK